jgi:hypothetical protein
MTALVLKYEQHAVWLTAGGNGSSLLFSFPPLPEADFS